MSRYYSHYYGYSRTGSGHSDRVLRAFEQPLQLLQCRYFSKSERWELRVSSSTGHGFYELKFNSKSGTCNCPDFERRGKPCKHMLCVLLRILKLKDQEFTTKTQVGKSYNEITTTFLKLFHHDKPVEEDIESHGKKRKRKGSMKGEASVAKESPAKAETLVESKLPSSESAPAADEPEEMCIICLLEFHPSAETMSRCSADCQRWLGHKECLQSWFQKSSCCPLCKGIQQSAKSSSSSSSVKRSRYSYYDEEGEIDIEQLQAQADQANPVNAFFEIVHE